MSGLKDYIRRSRWKMSFPSWQTIIANKKELFGLSGIDEDVLTMKELTDWNRINIIARKSILNKKKLAEIEKEFSDVQEFQKTSQ